jgi:hypothetical protein
MNANETAEIRELKAEELTQVSGGNDTPTPAMLAKILSVLGWGSGGIDGLQTSGASGGRPTPEEIRQLRG